MVARRSVDLRSVDLHSVDLHSEAAVTDTRREVAVDTRQVDTLREDTLQAVVVDTRQEDTLQGDTRREVVVDILRDLLSEEVAADLSVEAVAEDTLQVVTLQVDSRLVRLSEVVDSVAAPTEFPLLMVPPHLHPRSTVLRLTVVVHRSVEAAADLSGDRPSVAVEADLSVDPLSARLEAAAHSAADSVRPLPATELPQCHRLFPRSTRPTVDTRKLINCLINCKRNRTSSRVNKSIL